MENSKTFVLGAVVAIAGVIVGTGAVLSTAQKLTAVTGMNPNIAADMDDAHSSDYDLEDYESLREMPYPDTATYSRFNQVHGAAPELGEFDLSHCEGLSGTRLTHCVVEYLENGTIYQHGQTNY